MRILHVGSGFPPLRSGGLFAYWDDLSAAQVSDGHAVAWFCPGRRYPGLRRPRLHRWTRDGVRVHEVLNSPLLIDYEAGTLDPLRDLHDPDLERLFAQVLDEVRPEVVHIQELLGVPTSIVDLARERGVPTVMTLQDYGPLCPTLKLLDADGQVNLRTEVGLQCARCSRAAPADDRAMKVATGWLHYERLLESRPWLARVAPSVKRALAPVLARRRPAPAGPPFPAPPGPAPPEPPARTAPPEHYQRRRDVNVARLGRIDRLVAMSTRVYEIYATLGVSEERMRVMPLTLAHISAMRPRPEPQPAGRPLHVATSNGCASDKKGGEVVVGALERLHADGRSAQLRVSVLGHVRPDYAQRLDRLPNVRRTGPYDDEQLDGLLDDVDVGVVPSVWEEAYGYVGPEYLAKGIPVIGNAIGGIPDYTRDGVTGWLNRDCSAQGLADILVGILERPEQVAELHRSILSRRSELIRSMPGHAAEMLAVYEDAAASAAPTGAAAVPAAPR